MLAEESTALLDEFFRASARHGTTRRSDARPTSSSRVTPRARRGCQPPRSIARTCSRSGSSARGPGRHPQERTRRRASTPGAPASRRAARVPRDRSLRVRRHAAPLVAQPRVGDDVLLEPRPDGVVAPLVERGRPLLEPAASHDVGQRGGRHHAEAEAACAGRVGGAARRHRWRATRARGRLPLVGFTSPAPARTVVDRPRPGGVGPGRRLGQHGERPPRRRARGAARRARGRRAARTSSRLKVPRSWVKTSCMKPLVLVDQRQARRWSGPAVRPGSSWYWRARRPSRRRRLRGRAVLVCRGAGAAARVDHQICRDEVRRRRPRCGRGLPDQRPRRRDRSCGGRRARARCTPRWRCSSTERRTCIPAVASGASPGRRRASAPASTRASCTSGRRWASNMPTGGARSSAGAGTASRRRAPRACPRSGPGSRSTRVTAWPWRARSMAAVIPLGPEPMMAMWRVMAVLPSVVRYCGDPRSIRYIEGNLNDGQLARGFTGPTCATARPGRPGARSCTAASTAVRRARATPPRRSTRSPQEAGVSRKTVFTSVGGKVELMKLAYDWAVTGDDEPVARATAPRSSSLQAEPDASVVIEKYVAGLDESMARVAPIHDALRSAADVDAQARELLETVEDQRLRGMGTFAADLDGRGALREGLSRERCRRTCSGSTSSRCTGTSSCSSAAGRGRRTDWLARLPGAPSAGASPDFCRSVHRPVAFPAVACPSGLRRTPRKRLWVQAHRGFKSLRHRVVMSRTSRAPGPVHRGPGALRFRACLEVDTLGGYGVGMDHTQTTPGYMSNKDDYARRMKRIEGQVRGIARMVDEEKYCIDILTQVSAVTKALQAVALGLLDEHMAHCVLDAAQSGGPEAEAKLRRRPRPSPGWCAHEAAPVTVTCTRHRDDLRALRRLGDRGGAGDRGRHRRARRPRPPERSPSPATSPSPRPT